KAIHHPLHGGSFESALSSHLLHTGMERAGYLRRFEHCGTDRRNRDWPMAAATNLFLRILPYRCNVLGTRRAGKTSASKAIHSRRGPRTPILLRHGLGVRSSAAHSGIALVVASTRPHI